MVLYYCIVLYSLEHTSLTADATCKGCSTVSDMFTARRRSFWHRCSRQWGLLNCACIIAANKW